MLFYGLPAFAWINLIDFRFSPSRAVTDDSLYQMSHCVSIPNMIFVSAIFARLSQMTRATLTAKMALTAKMRDCSRFVDYTYCQNGGQRVLIKKSRTQFWLSETSGIIIYQ